MKQDDPPPLRVKFLHRGYRKETDKQPLLRQFSQRIPVWGNCTFIFDTGCREYDWLVVYHDIPRGDGFFSQEKLACAKENTILLTAEPSTITVYGTDYLKQFGHIITFQEPWLIRHPGAIFHHPGLFWFYGRRPQQDQCLTLDQIVSMPPPEKSAEISTVCSARTGKTTLHSARVDFTWWLKEQLPQLEIYGHGVRPMEDKKDALDPYRYHIAIENHVYKHHLTEKLPDAFLGYTLPFYHGAPNAADYFPKESFIPIDFSNRERTLEIIRFHLANNEYEDRLPYIKEARRRVIEEENLFALTSHLIEEKSQEQRPQTQGRTICNRPTLRIKHPITGIRSLSEKVIIKTFHRISRSLNRKK